MADKRPNRPLIDLRASLGMTQQQLADEIGSSKSQVCKWLSGDPLRAKPALAIMERFRKRTTALGISAEELMRGRYVGKRT